MAYMEIDSAVTRRVRVGNILIPGRSTVPLAFDAAAFILRSWMGAMGIYHGYGKIFGGMEKFTEGVVKMGFPMPEFFAWAAALSEFAGGFFLILGFGTRPWALMIACTMAVAGFIRHADDPFKTQELALAYLAVVVVVFLLGPGRASIDGLLERRQERR
jgi:putative oxidoreductase